MAYDTCNNTATFLVLPHECGFTGERKWHSVPPTVLNFAIRALLGLFNTCSVELGFCCNCSSVFVFSFFHRIFANQVIPSLSGVWSQIGPEHVLEQEYCTTSSLSAGVTQDVEAVSSKASLVPALVYLICVGQPVRSLIGTDASAVCSCCCYLCFPGRTPGAGQEALPFTCRTSAQSRSHQQSFCAPAGLSHCCSSGKEAYIKKQGFCVPFKKYPACFDETLICLPLSLADSDLSSSRS